MTSTVLAYTIREACNASGLGRSSLYLLLKSGDLRARKHGARTLILVDDLRQYLERLPELAPPRTGKAHLPKKNSKVQPRTA